MYLPSFRNLDLFSAGVNALNGVLVARNPSSGAALVSLLFRVFPRRDHWPQIVPMQTSTGRTSGRAAGRKASALMSERKMEVN
jgi:hypothetical protein